MRYLASSITDLKNNTNIEPRTGIDLIAIKKYLTFQEPFNASIVDYFSGTKDTTTVLDIDSGNDYTAYDGLGYHLIDENGVDYGEISLIEYSAATYSRITVAGSPVIPAGTANYSISKYYQSHLKSAPTIQSSMERTGALAQTGTCQFDIVNPEDDTYVDGVYSWVDANNLDKDSGDALSADYEGRIVRISHSGGYELDAVITDIDLVTDVITVDKDIRYYADETYTVSIMLQTFFSDVFRTTPNIEDTQCVIREYLGDNEDVFYESNSAILMDGKIKSIGDLSQKIIPVTVYDTEKYLEENKIGELLTEDDGYMINGSPVEAIGQMKPYVIGNHNFTRQNTSHELTGEKNNLAKTIFLGYDSTTGKRRYLLSAVDINAENDIYLKNRSGRLNKIDSGDWSIASISGDEVVIEIDNITLTLTDYWYGNNAYGSFSVGQGGTYSDLIKSANNNADDHSNIDIYDAVGAHPSLSMQYTSGFNDWDMDQVEDTDISSVKVFGLYEHNTVDPSYPGTFEINSINATVEGTKTHEQFGTEAATQAEIAEDVRCWIHNATDPGVEYGDYVDVYLVYKEITYSRTLEVEEEIEIYADCDGVEYGTWINGRTAGDANDNTDQGGYYLYTHANDDDNATLIQNPVGFLEWLMREVKGKVNNDMDLDSFNRASIARSGWKCDFVISDQVESESFLQQFLDEFCLTLEETEEGYIKVIAYDITAPFTNNNMIFDGATESLLFNSSVLVSTGRSVVFYGMSNDYATNYQGICGNSGSASFSYIRFDNPAATRIVMETDTNADDCSWAGLTSFDDGLMHKIEVKNVGAGVWELLIDDVSKGNGSATTTDDELTIDYVGAGRTITSDYLDGTVGYFRILEDDGTELVSIESINEKIVDISGNKKFTEAGTITYELSDQGIYDYHSAVTDDEYVRLPIISGLPKFPKDNTALFTKLIQNYNVSNISGKYNSSDTDTNSTYVTRVITKEVNIDFIADDTTIQTRATLMLKLYARLPRVADIISTVAAIHHEKGDIVNVRTPVLNNGIYSHATMIAKKWIVIDKSFDTERQKYRLRHMELLT